MKLKKILAAAAASVMMLTTLTACSESGNSSNTDSGNGTSSAADSAANSGSNNGNSGNSDNTNNPDIGDKVFTVGICQLLEHPALDLATQGFQQALKDKLGEDHVKFDLQLAQNEVTNCTTITTNFVAAGVDLIMANATPSLTSAASATDTIPIVGTSITAYDVAFDGADWQGKNITGASDLAPIDEQAKMLTEIFPDAKKVGIMYCTAEANSVYQVKVFEEALGEYGIEYKEYPVTDSNEIQAQAQAAVGEVDVIYIPTDNTIAGATETVKNVTLPAKIPVVASEEGICQGCGTVTLSISYYDMGYTAGEMAYDILVNGKKAGDLEIGYSPVTKKYNKEICDELNLTIPDEYTAIEQ